MGRPKSRGRCACGFRFHPPYGEPLYFDDDGKRVPSRVQSAAARTNAAVRVGLHTTHFGVVLYQAVTENA